jgi:hypothetical protein
LKHLVFIRLLNFPVLRIKMRKTTNHIINWTGIVALVATSYCVGDLSVQVYRTSTWKSESTALTEYIRLDTDLANYGGYSEDQIRTNNLGGVVSDLSSRLDHLARRPDVSKLYPKYKESMKHIERDLGLASATGLIALMCYFLKDLKKREAERR